MLKVDHTINGTKITYVSNSFVQNPELLREIWYDLLNYYKNVDTHKIKINNMLSDHYMADFDFNKILVEIDPKKTLSYISDCTKKDCLFDRYKYQTRDRTFNFLIDNINKQNLSKFNILFIDSFQLLNELFYLTDLIKKDMSLWKYIYLIKHIVIFCHQ